MRDEALPKSNQGYNVCSNEVSYLLSAAFIFFRPTLFQSDYVNGKTVIETIIYLKIITTQVGYRRYEYLALQY